MSIEEPRIAAWIKTYGIRKISLVLVNPYMSYENNEERVRAAVPVFISPVVRVDPITGHPIKEDWFKADRATCKHEGGYLCKARPNPKVKGENIVGGKCLFCGQEWDELIPNRSERTYRNDMEIAACCLRA